MTYFFYKVLHIAGILGLFTAMGSLMAADRKKPVMLSKFAIMHGVSLLIILVGGFGMLAKFGDGQSSFPGWIIAKFIIWLILGAMLAILKRGKLSATIAWPVIVGLGTFAGYLAIYRPF